MIDIDFVCQFMLRDPNRKTVGCLRQVFGPFPNIATCARDCRGNPDAMQAKQASAAKIAALPRCEFLDLKTGECDDPELTTEQCVQLKGYTCRHFVQKQVIPCAACGDKGA